MAVYHVLADGTRTNDITGHVVKMTEAESVYHLMSKLNKRLNKEPKNDIKKDRRLNYVS